MGQVIEFFVVQGVGQPDVLYQGCSMGNSPSLPPVWLQTFPSREFPIREFPGNSRDSGISGASGISRIAGITVIPVPWKIPISKCTYTKFSIDFLR